MRSRLSERRSGPTLNEPVTPEQVKPTSFLRKVSAVNCSHFYSIALFKADRQVIVSLPIDTNIRFSGLELDPNFAAYRLAKSGFSTHICEACKPSELAAPASFISFSETGSPAKRWPL